jgi:hypothetical protein
VFIYLQNNYILMFRTPEAQHVLPPEKDQPHAFSKTIAVLQDSGGDKMNTILCMFRHAASPFVHGQERSRGLSEEGWKAAARVADILAEIDVHVMVSSPYARAVQTIRPLVERKSLEIAEYGELAERRIIGPDLDAPWDVLKEAIRRSFDAAFFLTKSTGCDVN